MNSFVVDASVAIKWVVEEHGTAQALAVRKGVRLIAPNLLVAECANILWEKVQPGELLATDCRRDAMVVMQEPRVVINRLYMYLSAAR